MRLLRRSSSLAWPYLAGLIVLVALPLVGTLWFAFTEFSGIVAPRFVGLDNFSTLLGAERFWLSLGNSFVYVAIAVPLRLLGAVAFALLLNRRFKGSGGARAIAYLPTVIPDVAYALLWLWILNPLYGPLTAALEAVGASSPGWLTDPWAARFSVAFMGAFQIGEGFVIALAARRSIPQRLYEAAAVDGARPFLVLRRITLPLMAPILAVLALRDVLLSFHTNFVPALIVTGGGDPRYATFYLPLYVYQTGFRYGRLGYASAVTVAIFAIMAVILVIQYRLVRRWRVV